MTRTERAAALSAIATFLGDHGLDLDGSDAPHVAFDSLLDAARDCGLDIGCVVRAGSRPRQLGSYFELNVGDKWVARVLVLDPMYGQHGGARVYATKANTARLAKAAR